MMCLKKARTQARMPVLQAPHTCSTGILACVLALLSVPSATHADSIAEGRDLYNRSCTTCHGLNGAAGDRAPALAAEREYLRTSAEDIFEAIRHGIPGSLMPASSLPDADIRKVVAYIRSLRAPASEQPVAGDVSHGEAIFRTTGRCLDCHMRAGRGGLLGPDLSDIGGKRSLSALRAALTQARPNTVRGYQAARVVTVEGKALTGIVKNENNFSVQVLDSAGTLHLFTREELREITYQKNSLMPSDYDQQLTSAEMQDLLAFLSRRTK
jgi:cytochrome c oxidase cbb3-type subunit III